MSAGALNAQELTRRVIARVTAESAAPDNAALAAQAACEQTYHELSRSVGFAGAEALLSRALLQAQRAHPLLASIHIVRRSDLSLDGVADAAIAHGDAAVAAALESVLETLLGLLGRLVGDDMVVRLIEPSMPNGTQDHQAEP